MDEKIDRLKSISNIINDMAVLRRRTVQSTDEWWGEFSRSQRELVGILLRHPRGISVKELARIIKVSSSAITQRVETLEKLKLIERHSSPMDNRYVSLLLSKKAHTILRKSLPSFSKQVDKHYLHILDDSELKQFEGLLAKIAHVIEPKQK
jgi:MarR family transcriptional regulator, organic hydroperoxide resistance regulator